MGVAWFFKPYIETSNRQSIEKGTPPQHGAWQSTDTVQRTERTGYGKG